MNIKIQATLKVNSQLRSQTNRDLVVVVGVVEIIVNEISHLAVVLVNTRL
jgi:hypothetical protein